MKTPAAAMLEFCAVGKSRNLGDRDVSLFGWDVLVGGGAGGDEPTVAVDSQIAGADEIRLASRRVGGDWGVVLDYSCDVVSESDTDVSVLGFARDVLRRSGLVCSAENESTCAGGNRLDSSAGGGCWLDLIVSSNIGKIGRDRVDTKISGAYTQDSQTRAPRGSAACRLVF